VTKTSPSINHETVVFTKHARERMDLRNIGEDMVIQVMRNPNRIFDTKDEKIKFIGKTTGAKLHIIGKPIPEENKWLVISLWVRGEEDDGTFKGDIKQHSKNDLVIVYLSLIIGVIIFLIIGFYVIQLR